MHILLSTVTLVTLSQSKIRKYSHFLDLLKSWLMMVTGLCIRVWSTWLVTDWSINTVHLSPPIWIQNWKFRNCQFFTISWRAFCDNLFTAVHLFYKQKSEVGRQIPFFYHSRNRKTGVFPFSIIRAVTKSRKSNCHKMPSS